MRHQGRHQVRVRQRWVEGVPHVLVGALVLAMPLLAQAPRSSGADPIQPGPMLHGEQFPGQGPGGLDVQANARRISKLNEARQKSIVSNAAKLLRLATELQATGAETNPADLPDNLHRVAEIEKLAHDIKEKMKYSIPLTPLSPTTDPFDIRQR